MSNPASKIEVYNASNELIYSLTSKTSLLRAKDILTSTLGTFTFTLPGREDTDYKYYDIVPGFKVKIWFGYDTISGDPFLVGKIQNVFGTSDNEGGYQRVFSGKSLTEVLQRRIKTDNYMAEDASAIVTELATDLGLGTENITSDLTDVTLYVEDKTYFELMQALSDYWYSAASQINKDFYVSPCNTHANGDLFWKTRPFRTITNEYSLTTGSSGNIESCVVTRDKSRLINKLKVYGTTGKIGVPGEEGRKEPSDGDLWTLDDLNNWVADWGTKSEETTLKKVGTNSLLMTSAASGPESGGHEFTIKRSLSGLVSGVGKDMYQTLNFWHYQIAQSYNKVRLYAPNLANRFEADLGNTHYTWQWKSFQLGQNQEYDADKNPNAPWMKTGSPNWTNLTYVVFHSRANQEIYGYKDNLYFGHGRFRAIVEDSASQTNYGIHEAILIDDNLLTDSQCESRGKTVISQNKDPTLQIELTVKGILEPKIGDRVALTIPAENISAQSFDILSIEHILIDKFTTIITATSSERQKEKALVQPQDLMHKIQRDIDKLTRVVNR